MIWGYETYLLQNLDLRLRLGSTVSIVPPAIDEGLEMFAVLHLCLILLLQVLVPLGLCGVELCKVSIFHTRISVNSEIEPKV